MHRVRSFVRNDMFHMRLCLFPRLRKASTEMTMQRQLIAEECHETRIWVGFF